MKKWLIGFLLLFVVSTISLSSVANTLDAAEKQTFSKNMVNAHCDTNVFEIPFEFVSEINIDFNYKLNENSYSDSILTNDFIVKYLILEKNIRQKNIKEKTIYTEKKLFNFFTRNPRDGLSCQLYSKYNV